MKKNHIFCLSNLIIALVIGMIFYYLFEPNVIFVKMIDAIIGRNFHINIESSLFIMIIRNYFFDVLWGYSFIFALALSIGSETANLRICINIAVMFSIMMETLQIFAIVPGTYDIIDILV